LTPMHMGSARYFHGSELRDRLAHLRRRWPTHSITTGAERRFAIVLAADAPPRVE
jgi:hypothetical protein